VLNIDAERSKLAYFRRDTSLESRLQEVANFGSNPGNLRMFRYLPKRTAISPAMIVVLHGCTQTAAGYDRGAGWSALADEYGFILLFPEQQRANNPNGCFNWFQSHDVRRGQGEVASIRQMIERCVCDHGIDPGRIFVTGLSAGGAMTSAMLACYPEVFAGGAIIAGLPFGAAEDVRGAFQAMAQSPAKPAKEWGDLVRQASKHPGPWPRVSVWHGGADTTVIPANAREILKQWKDVHGVAETSMREDTVDGFACRRWKNIAGEEVIESFTIPRMMHGTPLATGNGNNQGGVAGPFMLETGISSSHHIAKFFQLTGDVALEATQEPGGTVPSAFTLNVASENKHGKPRGGLTRIDIGAVIESALKAAGLR
jgi:poly(hydroxyalkanoate) depolymerase family esterase